MQNSEEKELKQQKEALKPFIGSLSYNKPFNPAKLDSDLAKITEKRKKRGLR